MSTNPFVLNELSECIRICSAGLYSILEKYYKFSVEEIIIERDYALLENYGFLLAYLHKEGGIDNKEAKTLAAIVTNDGGQSYFDILGNAMCFYSKLLFHPDKESTLCDSIIAYNLVNPRTWDNFEKGIPIKEMDFFKTTAILTGIKGFLKNELPNRVNPILERL